MIWRRAVMILATAVTAGGCAYYNSMWSAERHAKEARRLEQRGRSSEARAEWTQAAGQAQIVTLRHPHSRWADDALGLRAEALARSGACPDAAEPLAQARAAVRDPSLRERVDLAAAACALASGDLLEADAALTAPLASSDADRRSRAERIAGEVAMARADYGGAVDHFSRSHDAAARRTALLGQQRLRIARAGTTSDLTPVVSELTQLLRTEPEIAGAAQLLELLTTVMTVAETPAARFRVAEVARDSLHAPALAAELFLDAAARDPGSLYAPKALIAALAVLPDRRDSIVALLDSRYADSPYTRAFHGESSVAYAAAEDSLGRALGVATVRTVALPTGASFGAPRSGPRGPLP